jgi:hypothetical protein
MGQVNVAARQLTSLAAAVSLCNGISRALSAVVTAGGTGYKIGDILTVSGGTNIARAAQFVVDDVDPTGIVTRVRLFLNRSGGYTATPANAAATTTNGAGSGCTLTVTYQSGGPPEDATSALVQAESQAVRYRDDGTDPTASVGATLASGDSVVLTGDLSSYKFIEQAASAKLNITFMR